MKQYCTCFLHSLFARTSDSRALTSKTVEFSAKIEITLHYGQKNFVANNNNHTHNHFANLKRVKKVLVRFSENWITRTAKFHPAVLLWFYRFWGEQYFMSDISCQKNKKSPTRRNSISKTLT